MERTVKFNYKNKEYKLALPSVVELDFIEEYELESIFDILEIKGSKRVEAVVDLLKKMNEKAGGEQIQIPEDIYPADLSIFQTAMLQAMILANKRDVKPDEVDEGLMELEKKKEDQPARISWFSRVVAWVFRSKTSTTPR